MKLKIFIKGQEWEEEILDSDLNESNFWKTVAKHLLDVGDNIPNYLIVECELGSAQFTIRKRGHYVKDGVDRPSMYVTVDFNSIKGLNDSDYDDAYLTCVNPESNNYKFYWLQPKTNVIDATYGRIGSSSNEAFGTRQLQDPYDHYMYWIRYYEKLSKGYIDQTDVFLKSEPVKKKVKVSNDNDKEKEDTNSPSFVLYHQLMAYARHVVDENLVNKDVTAKQVSVAKKELRLMGQMKTVKGFNRHLKNLLAVCPRKTRHVDELFASVTDDFSKIVQREENLIAAMDAVVGDIKGCSRTESFKKMGIEVYLANDKQREQVLGRLGDNLKSKVKTIYRVINKTHQERFNNYLKQNNISKVKQLWHGSRNENWFSIIENGLELYPNASITGKMFGQGIYFAPSAQKSWGYTSCQGTYWANGRSASGFMGLYATAYGNPLSATTASSFSQTMLKARGKNCVHAFAGIALRNDEIIFYDEASVVLNYIVEFE